MLVSGLSCAWNRSPPICSTNSLMSDAIGSKPSARNTSPCSSLACVRMRMPRQSSGVRIGRTRFREMAEAVIPVLEQTARRLGVDLTARQLAELAVERPERDGAVGDHKRQLEELELRGRPRK